MTPVTVRKISLGEGRPKICIPLIGNDEEQIVKAAEEIKKLPAEVVEWRADSFFNLLKPDAITKSLILLRKILGQDMPILFTVRTKEEGGEVGLSQEEYSYCCIAAAEGEADFVDVELTAGKETIKLLIDKVHQQGKKVILSSHDFTRTPDEEEMLCRLRQMQEWGADISKLAVMPNHPSDVLRLLSVTLAMKETYADRPFITMSMGADGMISRLCGETFGSCMTFGCAQRASAPGQMDAKVLEQVLKALSSSSVLPHHLFFIGFMGTGKSTIARMVSRCLGVEQMEMDQRIVEKEGMEINEIFSRYGEEYFRDLETEMLRELSLVKPAIISCGGGIVLRKENVSLMQKLGRTILLTASPETVLSRVERDDSRPNLRGRKNVEGIRELMDQRREYYEAAAQMVIATDKKSPEEVAELVILSFSEKKS